MTTTKLPLCICPRCGHKLDAASTPDGSDHVPKPGDVTLCIECGCLFEFDSQMRVKKVDLHTLPRDVRAEVIRVQNAIHRVGSSIDPTSDQSDEG